MATANPGGANQFLLKILELRVALTASEAEAGKAVAAGRAAVTASEEAVKKAVGAKDLKEKQDALVSNKESLNSAEKAHKNLVEMVRLIKDSCCEQSQGCDPNFA